MAASNFNVDTPQGLTDLNKHLEGASYIGGYTPSKADITVLDSFKTAPDAAKVPHVSRWFNHISSFSQDERKQWGEAKQVEKKEDKKADDFDLFGEDDDEAEREREALIEKRAQEQLAKKAASGKVIIAKSAVVLDVKPWEDTTDMKLMEELVRKIAMDGLEWKASKLGAIGYGIKKLQISCHIEDDKVSVDDIQEQIQALEDLVQSTDVVTFTKL
jgi:elongation factor 1-beta